MYMSSVQSRLMMVVWTDAFIYVYICVWCEKFGVTHTHTRRVEGARANVDREECKGRPLRGPLWKHMGAACVTNVKVR
jgi:hypothetical protein